MSLTTADAADFADQWYAAWNAHDLDAILEHYASDIEFTSPFVISVVGDPTGVVCGKPALRAYFAAGLARYPDLRFVALDVLLGLESVTLSYISVGERRAAEVMTLDEGGRVTRVVAHYSGGL